MNKQSSQRLLDSIDSTLKGDEVEEIKLHVETLVEAYHRATDRINELELELASANFDRFCLANEKRALELKLPPSQANHEALIEGLVREGIPRDKKIAAIKYVKGLTGWSLKDAKNWVEEFYYES